MSNTSLRLFSSPFTTSLCLHCYTGKRVKPVFSCINRILNASTENHKAKSGKSLPLSIQFQDMLAESIVLIYLSKIVLNDYFPKWKLNPQLSRVQCTILYPLRHNVLIEIILALIFHLYRKGTYYEVN